MMELKQVLQDSSKSFAFSSLVLHLSDSLPTATNANFYVEKLPLNEFCSGFGGIYMQDDFLKLSIL